MVTHLVSTSLPWLKGEFQSETNRIKQDCASADDGASCHESHMMPLAPHGLPAVMQNCPFPACNVAEHVTSQIDSGQCFPPAGKQLGAVS